WPVWRCREPTLETTGVTCDGGAQQFRDEWRLACEPPLGPALIEGTIAVCVDAEAGGHPYLGGCRLLQPLLQIACVVGPDGLPLASGVLRLLPLDLFGPVSGSYEYERHLRPFGRRDGACSGGV